MRPDINLLYMQVVITREIWAEGAYCYQSVSKFSAENYPGIRFSQAARVGVMCSAVISEVINNKSQGSFAP